MKIFRLIVFALFCMSFVALCFFTVLLLRILDNIRVEEELRYSWIVESPIVYVSTEEWNARLRQVSFEIEESLTARSRSDVAVFHEIVYDEATMFLGVNFYVRYDIPFGERCFSSVSRSDKRIVEAIVRDNLERLVIED